MRFNIKKTIIASLLFSSGASFAQLHEMQQLVLDKERESGTVSSAPVDRSEERRVGKECRP